MNIDDMAHGISERLYRSRLRDIPEPIAIIGRDNALVAQIIEAYGTCGIVTLEEALCQMVIGLNRNWEWESKRYYEVVQSLSHGLTSKEP